MSDNSEVGDLSLHEMIGRVQALEAWQKGVDKALAAQAGELEPETRRLVHDWSDDVDDTLEEYREERALLVDPFGLKAAMAEFGRRAQKALREMDQKERRKAVRRLRRRYTKFFMGAIPAAGEEGTRDAVNWFFLDTFHHGHRISILNAAIIQGVEPPPPCFNFPEEEFYAGWGRVLDWLREFTSEKGTSAALAFFTAMREGNEAVQRQAEMIAEEVDAEILEVLELEVGFLTKLSGMADALGDGSWREWTDEQAHEVEATLDAVKKRLGGSMTKPYTRDDKGWRKAIVDVFGEIPEGVDEVGWFKHQVGELRGKLEWTESALDARRHGEPEPRPKYVNTSPPFISVEATSEKRNGEWVFLVCLPDERPFGSLHFDGEKWVGVPLNAED